MSFMMIPPPMTGPMTVAIDTNILVYAFDRQAQPPGRHEAAVALLERLHRADCVIPGQVLGEFITVAVRKCGMERAKAVSSARTLATAFPVVFADQGCFERAMALFQEHKLQFWDSLICATAERHGCTLLLSEDFQDGRRLGATLILNPFNAGNRVVLDAALPAVE